MIYSGNLENDTKIFDDMISYGKSYDILKRTVDIGENKACIYCIGGYFKDDIMQKLMENFAEIKKLDKANNPFDFCEKYLPHIESYVGADFEEALLYFLSGTAILMIDGMNRPIIIDVRKNPARSVQQPENDKVLRGSHEGFVETLLFNTALIRRRIRSPELTLELIKVGEKSRTDVCVCYIEGKADEKLVGIIRKKLKSIRTEALTMGQESLRECLVPHQVWNPFPRIRYTERPDTASASILDGNIIVLVDGSPSVMILPTGIFDFVQDINDYYFSPCVGSYIRLVRFIVFFVSLLMVPSWYLLIQNPEKIPFWLSALLIEDEVTVPVLVQLIVIEFVIDALKLASLNTPGALSNSFSVVGALVLGEFAVNSGLFSSEAVLLMSFVAISNFTQPSFELGYAIKLSRLMITVLTALFGSYGFIGGIILVVLTVIFTKTVGGYTYLYPVKPFNKEALKGLIIRRKIKVNYEES